MSRQSRGRAVPNPAGLVERKAFFQLDDKDAARLRRAGAQLTAARAGFLDRFYEHLLSFPTTRALLTDPATLQRLRQTQARYFDQLLAGEYGTEYAEDRFRIGITHHRVGLEPTWYMGAYAVYLRLLVPEIWEATGRDWSRAHPVIDSVIKVMFLDMSIAIDAYGDADRRHILDLKRTNERIVASVPSGLLVANADLRVLAANRAFCESCGCDRDAVTGRPVVEVLGTPQLEPYLRQVLVDDQPVAGLQFTARCPTSGAERPVRVTVTGIELAEEEEEEELLVVEDLSAVERLEERTKALERRFREVVERATDGIVLMDRHGHVSYFNAAAEHMFDRRREEVIGTPGAALIPEAFRAAAGHAFARYLGAGPASWGRIRQVEGLRRDGALIPLESTVSTYQSEDDLVVTAVLRDVTERRAAEIALQRSEQSFRALVERLPDAVVVHREGRIAYVNPAALTCFGYQAPGDLLGRPFLDLVHPQHRATEAAWIQSMAESGTASPVREIELLRRNDSAIVVEMTALPVVFAGEDAVAVVARDVSERREQTARMMRLDRIITIGTLAAGVGHEINNPLTYVAGNLDLAEVHLSEFEAALRHWSRLLVPTAAQLDGQQIADGIEERLMEFHETFEAVRDGAHRIEKIVRDLQAFSRAKEDARELVNVQRAVEWALKVVANEIRHRARLVTDYADTPPVLADEARLGEVFLNLLMNAAQAMPVGDVDRNEIQVRTMTRDSWVVVEVRDTGAGIAREHVARIFEPFFTTKPVGQGTGLGLSICQRIVSDLGGDIQVESELGKGSTFRVLLPVSQTIPAAASGQPPEIPVSGRRGRVLIVEDEVMVGAMLRRMLSPDHDVECVTSGRAALDLLRGAERFDAILCDVMMPEVSGKDLYETLTVSFPGQAERVIFMTGGAFAPEVQDFLAGVSNPCVSKPVDTQELRKLVRRVVG